jgi:hypothetical protein
MSDVRFCILNCSLGGFEKGERRKRSKKKEEKEKEERQGE